MKSTREGLQENQLVREWVRPGQGLLGSSWGVQNPGTARNWRSGDGWGCWPGPQLGRCGPEVTGNKLKCISQVEKSPEEAHL